MNIVQDKPMVPMGYVKYTVTGGAKPLTPPPGANAALIRVETANIRWRDDGAVPTATDGMLMQTTDPLLLVRTNLDAFQFILAAGAPVLHVNYYKV
jgi:hypothetical protein